MKGLNIKKINIKKIKEVLSDGNFKTVAIGVGMSIVFTATIAGLLGEEIQKEKIHDQISSVEYVIGSESIKLENLYIVEKDETKYLCTKELLREDEIFNIAQRYTIYKSTGTWIPPTYKKIYVYKDIVTKEFICTDELNFNINVFSVCDSVAEEVKNNKINVEDIDSDYINNFISDKTQKTK